MPAPLDRELLFADRSVSGAALCRAYSDRVDQWVDRLFREECGAPGDVAVVAVGGYGRQELSPQSDIDVVLVHRGRKDIGEIAERLWYPIWDEGVKLGHAVRTIREALSLAASDLDTATSLLSVRHLAGAPEITADLAEQSRGLWRKRSKRWLTALGERVRARQAAAGEVAFLLEPDLKEGRGGLRDVHAIHWAEAADRVMFEGDDVAFEEAYQVLLAARVELHRATGRLGDRLLLQEQDAVADALGDGDADELMARVARAARTIAWRSDEVWDGISATLKGGLRWRSSRDRPLVEGVIRRDGRVHVAADADPGADPSLVLRVAAVAARTGLRIDRPSLERLAAEAAPLPDPWPDEARRSFVDLLLAGVPAVDVIESLDQVGLWVSLLPEWRPVRSRPQRNAYHRFTVDRHLCETAVEASALVDRVERPDLLALGALWHDIGKGYPGDHAVVGVGLVETMGRRLGLDERDRQTLATMVRDHLLLPDVATRRDLSDEATIGYVAGEVGDLATLHLLGALTEADSIATGPAAWGSWKAELVAELVTRTDHWMRGGEPAELGLPDFPTEEHLALLEETSQLVTEADDRLLVIAPDRPGLFSRVAGALALNGLDVLDAAAFTHRNGMALESFRVEGHVGPTIPWDRVVDDVEKALDGQLALDDRLRERARVYGASSPRCRGRDPEVVFDLELSPSATVVEVHATDAVGVLYRVTRAFAELGLDIRTAKVQTLGPDVVDSFYVVDRRGDKATDPGLLAEVASTVRQALDDPPG